MLSEMEKGAIVNQRQQRRMIRKYNIKDARDIPEVREQLKQQILAKAQRVRRYLKRGKFFRQNKLFKEDTKRLYRELGKKQVNVEEPPPIEEIEAFWSNIWENEKHHDETAEWMQQQDEMMKNQPTQDWKDIEDGEVTLALKKTSNWKSPGIDREPNFWLKNLEKLYGSLTTAYNDIVKNPEKSPEWLTRGLTYLLPKNNETKNPKNYRPIACLPTIYKDLTSVITERTYTFLEGNSLLPQEQKGCKRGSYDCKDQLLINKMILRL